MRLLLRSAALLSLCSACGSAPSPISDGGTPSGQPAPGATVTSTAPTGPYHRIYQGYALEKLKRPEFTKVINRKFLPLFPKAHPQGLAAYRPALPKNPRACALPSEIALLSFTSEKDYAKYRESKIGKRIRDAHTLAFRADTSKSLVPEPLTDTIHFDHAYSMNPGAHDYVKSYVSLVVHCDPVLGGEDLRLALVKAYAAGTEATDVLFAVTSDHVLEYVFYPKKEGSAARIAERLERFRSVFKESTVVALPKRKIGKKGNVAVGEGLDAQW